MTARPLCAWAARALLAFSSLSAALGCSSGDIRIGTKPFAEQEIVAEILGQVLEASDVKLRAPHRCADTYSCQQALDEGRIDVLLEYTGTALHLLGDTAPTPTTAAAITRLQAHYAESGLEWVSPPGFSNSYVWVLRASANGSEQTLSQLAARGEPIRVAVDAEYMQRPRDGLTATADRYGIEIAASPLVIADPLERYKAVATGLADVAVGYTTDVNPSDLGLVALEDDLEFFTDYDAAFMVRSDALQRVPELGPALATLEGAIADEQMRQMNQAVALEGASTERVARRFVHEAALVPDEDAPRRTIAISVAVGSQTVNRAAGTVSLAAFRQLYPTRPISLANHRHPLDAVAEGKSRFALVTADGFFFRDRKQRVQRRQDVEAIAVLGHALIHRLRRPESTSTTIGVSSEGGEAALAVAEMIGEDIETFDDDAALIEALGRDAVGEAVMLAPAGDPALVDAVDQGAQLISVPSEPNPKWQLDHPYLRPSRMPPGVYAVGGPPIETFSTQLVLAGPASAPGGGRVVGGPAAAVELRHGSIGPLERQQLITALGVFETPDPSLPSASNTAPEPEQEPWVDALFNGLAFLFLGWLAVIVLAPRRGSPVADAESPS